MKYNKRKHHCQRSRVSVCVPTCVAVRVRECCGSACGLERDSQRPYLSLIVVYKSTVARRKHEVRQRLRRNKMKIKM